MNIQIITMKLPLFIGNLAKHKKSGIGESRTFYKFIYI